MSMTSGGTGIRIGCGGQRARPSFPTPSPCRDVKASRRDAWNREVCECLNNLQSFNGRVCDCYGSCYFGALGTSFSSFFSCPQMKFSKIPSS